MAQSDRHRPLKSLGNVFKCFEQMAEEASSVTIKSPLFTGDLPRKKLHIQVHRGTVERERTREAQERVLPE